MLQAASRGYAPTLSMGKVEEPALIMHIGDAWDKSVMRVNQSAWIIAKNIRHNITRQFPQFTAYDAQPYQHIAIVGGGWSLNDPKVYEELRQLYFEGTKLVALNGAGKWLMERNMRPSMMICMDSRPQNIEFLRDPIPNCKYLIASQCDPSMFDICEDRDTTIFHLYCDADDEEKHSATINAHLDNFYNKRWTKVPTAGTAGICAPMMCRMLGFEFQHLFGIDSCYAPTGEHHAYPQSWNDDEGAVLFEASDGRVFRASAWQASQAQTFVEMISVHGNQIQMSVHGDGLIAHLLKIAATKSTLQET